MPVSGIVVFVCLYIVATFFYPGGSQLDKAAPGFSWMQNYWCNLLNENAINGQPNAARPVALTAMGVLCFSLAYFWYRFPQAVRLSKTNRLVMQLSGVLAMATGLAIFTNYHDSLINIATLFGLVAVTGALAALRNLNWMGLFWTGLFAIALVGLNNILYYGPRLRYYLPLVQKATFLYFLVWMCGINIRMFTRGFSNYSSTADRSHKA